VIALPSAQQLNPTALTFNALGFFSNFGDDLLNEHIAPLCDSACHRKPLTIAG
jgi:hypothetical protein